MSNCSKSFGCFSVKSLEQFFPPKLKNRQKKAFFLSRACVGFQPKATVTSFDMFSLNFVRFSVISQNAQETKQNLTRNNFFLYLSRRKFTRMFFCCCLREPFRFGSSDTPGPGEIFGPFNLKNKKKHFTRKRNIFMIKVLFARFYPCRR